MIRFIKSVLACLILSVEKMHEAIRSWYWEPRRWHEMTKDRICVFYGHERIPKMDEPTSGGLVKCQDLERCFPNTPRGGNLLYLVSSALPSCPLYMAKIAQRKGVRLVVNQNGVAIPAYHGTKGEVINAPRRALLMQSDFVVYQSAFCQETAARFLGHRVGPSSILYNPVDTTRFVPGSRSLSGSRVTLLMAGSHCHRYRILSAINALGAMLKRGMSVRLLICGRFVWGGGTEESNLAEVKAYCQSLGLENDVELQGAYLQKDAVSVMHQGDILLHTKYMDPCPRLVVEALSCGLPIVYADSGGVPELVGERAGIGVAVPVDWDHIHEIPAVETAIAVQSVIEQYETFRVEARKRAVGHLDVKPWLDKHRQIFENLHAV